MKVSGSGKYHIAIDQGGLSEALSSKLFKILENLMAMKNIHHTLMAIETGDRSTFWSASAGSADADKTPLQPYTPFMVASITKTFIATAILKLQEEGCLDIWRPAADYLPPELIEDLHILKGTDYSRRITIYNLLSHTSGLPDYIEERPRGGISLVEKILKEGDTSFSTEFCINLARESLKPHFPPQDPEAKKPVARYSDTNYRLLIAIIEKMTGKDQQKAFEELLFKPLELKYSYLPGESPLEPVDKHTTLWFKDQPLDIPLALRSFGDFYSTTKDLIRFMRALVEGNVFKDPAVFSLMQKRWNRFGFSLDPARLRSPGWPIEYGLGLMRFQLPPIFTSFKPIPAVIGHTGSTGTWLFYCPDLDLYLAGCLDQVTAGAVPYRVVPIILKQVISMLPDY